MDDINTFIENVTTPRILAWWSVKLKTLCTLYRVNAWWCHSHFSLPSLSLFFTTSLKHCAHFTAQSNTNYPITNFHRKSFKRTIATQIPCETSNSLSFKRNRYLSLVMTQRWAQYGQIGNMYACICVCAYGIPRPAREKKLNWNEKKNWMNKT